MTQPTSDDLARVPVFASLDESVRERIASRLDVVEYAEGERIVVEGEPGTAMYIIDRGRATTTQRERGLVGLMGPGSFFGEIALLGEGQRTATVTAASAMVVWVLHADAIRALKSEQPQVAAALVTAMQDRLARG